MTDQRSDSNKTSPVDSSMNDSAFSSITGWTIKYKTIPKSTQPGGIWDGYQTKEEFMMMHLR